MPMLMQESSPLRRCCSQWTRSTTTRDCFQTSPLASLSGLDCHCVQAIVVNIVWRCSVHNVDSTCHVCQNQFSVEHLLKPNQHPTPVSNILPQCSIWWQGHLRQPSSCWGKSSRPVPGFYVSQGILTNIILMRSSNLGEINPRGRALHKQHHQESARHHRTSDHRGTSHQYACTMWILWGVPGGGEAGQALPSSPS